MQTVPPLQLPFAGFCGELLHLGGPSLSQCRPPIVGRCCCSMAVCHVGAVLGGCCTWAGSGCACGTEPICALFVQVVLVWRADEILPQRGELSILEGATVVEAM